MRTLAARHDTDIQPKSSTSNRFVMVSNRAPFEHRLDKAGQLIRCQTDGGVVSALSVIAESRAADWIACAATDADAAIARKGQRIKLGNSSRLSFVAPPAEAYDLFYNTFCNPILWFLQHGMIDRLEMPNWSAKALHAWQLGYLPVNQSIAERVAEAMRGRINHVMFHDYHFYLAPLFLRSYQPSASLQQFIHIPWPDPEEWERLPPKITESICRGLLANDSVVFQTPDSVDNFLATCECYLPDIRVDFREAMVWTRERVTSVWANPISVDPVDLHRRLLSRKAEGIGTKLASETGEHTIIRVDRLDPSKNILSGFEAFETLLDSHPEWRGRVRFLAFLIPSRTAIREYASYADAVFATVDRINKRFGSASWEPVKVFHEQNRLQSLVAMRLYDVLLVNSLADGMNLVSKEGPVLNERDGVLVLSKEAGSYDELGEAALGIEPSDIGATAAALHRALSMPVYERRERAAKLRTAILNHQLDDWMHLQLDELGVASSPETPAGYEASTPSLSKPDLVVQSKSVVEISSFGCVTPNAANYRHTG